MTRLISRITLLCSLLCCGMLALTSVGCGEKGPKVRKNAFGAPDLSAPSKSPGKAFVVPENLIPPGAAPTKTETGVSDRIYATTQRASEVKTFFEGALQDASIESVREGEHVTVRGGGWLIEVYGGGEGAPTTIVYAQEKEL